MHRLRSLAPIVSTLLLLAGCGADSPSDPSAPRATSQALKPGTGPPPGSDCQFARAVTTCRTTTAQRVETQTHAEVSGCMAFNGTAFVPGRRTRTFADQVQMSDVTTTLQHGRNGRIFDTRASAERLTLSSTLVSDECLPI
jgi:hypothetical protein